MFKRTILLLLLVAVLYACAYWRQGRAHRVRQYVNEVAGWLDEPAAEPAPIMPRTKSRPILAPPPPRHATVVKDDPQPAPAERPPVATPVAPDDQRLAPLRVELERTDAELKILARLPTTPAIVRRLDTLTQRRNQLQQQLDSAQPLELK